MGVLPNIGPEGSSFPLCGTPSLRVAASAEGVPSARRSSGTVLEVEVENVAGRRVGVQSVRLGFVYQNALAEALFGRGAPELGVRELSGGPPLPAELDAGESLSWSAGLDQLAGELERRPLTLAPHSVLADPGGAEEEILRGQRPGRAALAVRNALSAWSRRRPAVVVRDERGALHKAEVRWRPPGGGPPDPPVPRPGRV